MSTPQPYRGTSLIRNTDQLTADIRKLTAGPAVSWSVFLMSEYPCRVEGLPSWRGEARKAEARGEVPVEAVAVRDGEVRG